MKQTADPVISEIKGNKGKFSKFFHYYKYAIVIAVVLVAVIFVGLAINKYRNDHKKPTISFVCTDPANQTTLLKAKQAMQGNSPTQQKQMALTIQKISGYENDPNCLYVMTEYYIDFSNAQYANKFFNMLTNLNMGHAINSIIANQKSIATLKEEVNAVNNNAKAVQGSILYSPPKGSK